MSLDALIAAPAAAAAVGLAAGFALGLVQFASLRRVTALYLRGGSLGRAIALQVGRLAVMAAGLTGLALMGTAPLLFGALGILLARQLVLRQTKREDPED